ncbi:MAG: IPT/TIG domain-containing protein [Syntrophobacteraceae bacterium]
MGHHLRHSLAALSIIAAVLDLLGGPGAWAGTTVTPNEGTIGTIFTLSGSNFGTRQGVVLLGHTPVRIVAWTRTKVQCKVDMPLRPQTYRVTLFSAAKPYVRRIAGFTIRRPSVTAPVPRPQFVSPGQEIIIRGEFFGRNNEIKKVALKALDGEKRNCRIINWTMNSIRVQLPRGILGIFSLIVTNQVGTTVQPWWGTFAPPPGSAQGAEAINYGGEESYDNATAVTYQNKLWVFWPGKNKYIYYRTWDGTTWSGITQLIDTGGSEHQTYAQLNPVVVDNYLFMFETRLDGQIHVTQYDPLHFDEEEQQINPVWINKGRIPFTLYDVKGRFAAAYNQVTKYVEIYMTPDNKTIRRLTYNPASNTYKDRGVLPIQLDPSHPTIVPYLTAVWNGNETDGTYVTYLSWSDTYAGAVTEVKDGKILYQTRLWYWDSRNTSRGPSLVDLTEKHLAVIYNHWDNCASYQKYDKDTHSAVGIGQQYEIRVPFNSAETCNWAPNGAVFSKKVADPTSATGDHMESRFYAIVENNPKHDEANWQFVECEYLGYWKPTGPPNYVDFQGKGLSGSDAINERLADMFPSWPVLGLVDMPPFVRNGHGECQDYLTCLTAAEMDFTLATTDGLSGEYSGGVYVESGRRSPVTYDISTGYAGGFENSKTFTYTITGGIEENTEGRIVAYYLVPSFNVYRLEWYDLNGLPTDIYTNSLETLKPGIRKEAFAPDVGPDVAYYQGKSGFTLPYINVAKTPAEISDTSKLPMHAFNDDRTRLATYSRNPTLAPFSFTSIVDPALSSAGWAVNSPGGFEWAIDEEHSIDNGFYCNIKIGYEVAHRVGFGAEGSVKIMVNTKTQKSVKAITNFRSQSPLDNTDPNRVTSFNVEGYWLKPAVSAYWVPNNRKSMGDTPWFITYRVTDYHP